MDPRTAEILREMAESVKHIERAVGRLTGHSNGQVPKAPPRRAISPERKKALMLQGSYLGYMRHLRPGQKATVKKARQERGIRSAIKVARDLAKAS